MTQADGEKRALAGKALAPSSQISAVGALELIGRAGPRESGQGGGGGGGGERAEKKAGLGKEYRV